MTHRHTDTARQRLEASRLRLIQQIRPPAPNHQATPAVARSDALTRLALRWCQAQPWYPGSRILLGTLMPLAEPWVRRHPWLAMAISAGGGASSAWLLTHHRRQLKWLFAQGQRLLRHLR